MLIVNSCLRALRLLGLATLFGAVGAGNALAGIEQLGIDPRGRSDLSLDSPFRCYADDNLENGRPYGPHPLDVAYETARLKAVASSADVTAARAALVVAKANLDASVTVTKTYTTEDVLKWYAYVAVLEAVRDVTERAYQGGLVLLAPDRGVTWSDLVNHPDAAIRSFAAEYVDNLSGSIGFSLTGGVPFGLDQILKEVLKASLLEKLKSYRDAALAVHNDAVASGAPSLFAETRFPSPEALVAYNDAKLAVETAVAQSTVDGQAAFEAQQAAQNAPSDLPACDSSELKLLLAQAFCPPFDNPITAEEEAGTPGITARFNAKVAEIRALACGFQITSGGGRSDVFVSVPENETTIMTLVADDPGLATPTVTFAITGGADQALFALGQQTGALTFRVGRDFENLADSDRDNRYEVVVTAFDSQGRSAVQAVYVSVTDVEDESSVPPPAVASLSPASGSAEGGSTVTLTGANFSGATGVSFGGTAATSFNVDSATSITAIVPAHAAGAVDVSVTTPAGTSDTAGAGDDFTYLGVSGIAPFQLPSGRVGTAYSATLTAIGCVGPCTFAVTGGPLPTGISLSSAGVLSGTPTAGGPFEIGVTATDAGAGNVTASHRYRLVIGEATVTSTSTLVAAQRGFAYSQTLVGSGGTGPYTFVLQTGPLPAGITLSSAGLVSGTPTVIGTFPVVVRVTDSSTGSGPFFSDVSLTLEVNAAVITITPTALPDVMAGVPYDRLLSASGGSGTYTYAVISGALPTGITLSSAGRISGKSDQVGEANFTVSATDSFGNSGSAALRLSILARPDPSQDPDVRGLDAAQAEATRRLTGTQMENFSRRLEQLNSGTGDQPVSLGLTLNSGLTRLGQEPDQRPPFGGRQMFGQSQVDLDRAELNALLLSSAGDSPDRKRASPGGGSDPAYGTGFGVGSDMAVSPGAGRRAAGQADGGLLPSGGPRFWTGGAITLGERDATTNQARFSVRSSGVSLGVDFPVSPRFDLGVGGGFGRESANVGRRDSSVDTSNFVGVVYGSWRPRDGVHFDAMMGYGTHRIDLRRRVSIDDSLVSGQRDGVALFGSIGVGIDKAFSGGRISSYGRVESTNAELDAYTETGSALWALSYAKRDVESLQGVLGVGFAVTHLKRDSAWTPSLRLEYRHELADGGTQNLQYADWLAGPTYQIRSAGWDRGELKLGLGLRMATASGWTASSELGGQFSAGQRLGTLRLVLSRKF